ncbi:MAG: SAM-dependent methyltransferase [Burkholderiales bacterium]
MERNHFNNDPRTAYDSLSEAQRIAFAPIVFQACRVLRESGVLGRVEQGGADGMPMNEVAAGVSLPRYGVKVLLESGLGIGLFHLNDKRFVLSKLGHFVLHDPMTRVNMDVVHEICYRGMFDLEQSLREGRPAGLRTLGEWNTFYEGLGSLAPRARDSWLAFDHYYSDAAFPAALPLVFADRPRRLLDIGGNTGKWAVRCARFDSDVRVTIADLPQQLEMARQTIRDERLEDRVALIPADMLDESACLPADFNAVWMSQFLDCFSEGEIVSILRRAARALAPGGSLYILELFWDRQANATAAFCLQQTSLYFACIANGNSQMYHSDDVMHCVKQAGLEVVGEHDEVGLYHTLLKCRKEG